MRNVSLETTLLRVLRTKDKYTGLIRVVPKHVLEARSQAILDDYGEYFAQHPDIEYIELEPFFLWFRLKHQLDDEQRSLYQTLLHTILSEPADPAIEAGILERLVAADTAARVLRLIERWNDGEEADLYNELRGEVERYEAQASRKVKVPWVNADINSLLQDDKIDRGLHWRLACLNNSMRPLRGGDFGIMAGRPDKGKTTIIASEITAMAAQFDQVYGVDHGRSVLWFNNEGPGNRIVKRLYQAALNATMAELIKFSQAGTINSMYANAVGNLERIKVLDIHDFYSYEVEDILKRVKPGLVIFDMVDNIRFGGEAANNGQRTDQLLEAMYQWARVLGVKYDTPVIATSQISADGDGLQYPTLPMLKDSKTGKQGAADFIITLGAVNDPAYLNSRFIGLTKNKLRREGFPQSPQAEVVFDGERARVHDPVAA